VSDKRYPWKMRRDAAQRLQEGLGPEMRCQWTRTYRRDEGWGAVRAIKPSCRIIKNDLFANEDRGYAVAFHTSHALIWSRLARPTKRMNGAGRRELKIVPWMTSVGVVQRRGGGTQVVSDWEPRRRRRDGSTPANTVHPRRNADRRR